MYELPYNRVVRTVGEKLSKKLASRNFDNKQEEQNIYRYLEAVAQDQHKLKQQDQVWGDNRQKLYDDIRRESEKILKIRLEVGAKNFRSEEVLIPKFPKDSVGEVLLNSFYTAEVASNQTISKNKKNWLILGDNNNIAVRGRCIIN